jgi:SAM-dependent methyltransferase
MDATPWDERYAASDLVWGLEPNRFVREQSEHLRIGRAVDVACGEGRNAIWLAQLGWHVTGIDYSAVAIERARQLTSKRDPAVAARMVWRVEDATTMPLKAKAFDLAVISYLHLPPDQTETVVRNVARSVAPAGHLVIVGHDRRNLREGVGGPEDETLLYDPNVLRLLLGEIPGIVVELAETVERETPDGIALDTLVRARRS